MPTSLEARSLGMQKGLGCGCPVRLPGLNPRAGTSLDRRNRDRRNQRRANSSDMLTLPVTRTAVEVCVDETNLSFLPGEASSQSSAWVVRNTMLYGSLLTSQTGLSAWPCPSPPQFQLTCTPAKASSKGRGIKPRGRRPRRSRLAWSRTQTLDGTPPCERLSINELNCYSLERINTD